MIGEIGFDDIDGDRDMDGDTTDESVSIAILKTPVNLCVSINVVCLPCRKL